MHFSKSQLFGACLLALQDRETLIYNRVSKKGYVRLHTSLGDLNLELHCDIVTRTCHNFIKHCKDGYYNGTSEFCPSAEIVSVSCVLVYSLSSINQELHGNSRPTLTFTVRSCPCPTFYRFKVGIRRLLERVCSKFVPQFWSVEYTPDCTCRRKVNLGQIILWWVQAKPYSFRWVCFLNIV